jgi:hypothetical protein
MRHNETNSTDYYQHRADADRIARETEFHLQRSVIRKPAPTITLTNDRTRQATLFDNGGNDLPGQKHLFDDITQEPN